MAGPHGGPAARISPIFLLNAILSAVVLTLYNLQATLILCTVVQNSKRKETKYHRTVLSYTQYDYYFSHDQHNGIELFIKIKHKLSCNRTGYSFIVHCEMKLSRVVFKLRMCIAEVKN